MSDMDNGPLGSPPRVEQVLHLQLGVRVVASPKPGMVHALLHVDDQQGGVCR
jgi:hypothetical protein